MMLSKSCAKILRDFEIEQQKVPSYRLGQHFCNMYIKGQWPELFYVEDRQKCLIMIEKWLKDNCYENDMPPIVVLKYIANKGEARCLSILHYC